MAQIQIALWASAARQVEDIPGAPCGGLFLRERIKVRGNGVKYHLAYRTNPGTVELEESSGAAGGFQNDYESA